MKYTKKELKALETSTMIIYLIHNKVNKKNYVGQTVKTFNKRYVGTGVGAERVFGYTNSKLQEDLEKYGVDNFKVTLLEQNVPDVETLNELEKYYIKKYNGVTKGYNTLVGGNNYDKDKFYELRRQVKKLYLELKTINNIINGIDKKYTHGFYVEMVECVMEEIGWDDELQDLTTKRIDYYKQSCMEHIEVKLKEVEDLGFHLTLDDVIEFYNL